MFHKLRQSIIHLKWFVKCQNVIFYNFDTIMFSYVIFSGVKPWFTKLIRINIISPFPDFVCTVNISRFASRARKLLPRSSKTLSLTETGALGCIFVLFIHFISAFLTQSRRFIYFAYFSSISSRYTSNTVLPTCLLT